MKPVPELLLILRVVLALLLYGFLALVFYAIWRDLRERSREPECELPVGSLIVEAETEPQQRFALRAVTAIGRSRDNHVVIDDPFASSNHAVIVWRENTWWVEDLNSHNGTYLNDERIDGPRPLASGDRIAIGETTLRLDLSA